MADHIQDQLLDYYRALLAGGGTSAADRVEIDRLDPVPMSKCPHLGLEAEDEEKVTAEQGNIGFPQTSARFFGFAVTCSVAQVADYGRAGRTLALQVERLFNGSLLVNQAGGIARNGTRLMRTEFRRDGGAEKPVYQVVQHWIAGYVARDDAPDIPL